MDNVKTTEQVAASQIGSYLVDNPRFPFCKGCGHTSVMRRLNEALVSLQLSPRDVALVTDIGCVGLADGLFKTIHTVHTTHGRSTAFATGIAVADSILANGKLKTIVLIGDGGAMIGLQHLVHAAMLNVDVTVLICNNFVYGMTGGQGSGLTPECFVTATTPKGNIVPPVDLCEILRHSKAPFVARTLATDKHVADILKDAISFSGFAAVEVLELCTEFAVPENDLTGKKLLEVAEKNHWQLGVIHRDEQRAPYAERYREITTIDGERPHESGRQTRSSGVLPLRKPFSVVVAGSAGERVQSSASLVCRLALAGGLFATQKNDNPVTQGSGFSMSEIWLSPAPINFTGIEEPDVILVTSEDGFREVKNQGWFNRLGRQTRVLIDDSITTEFNDRRVQRIPFRSSFGGKTAALGALTAFLDRRNIIGAEKVLAVISSTYGPDSEAALHKGLGNLSAMNGDL